MIRIYIHRHTWSYHVTVMYARSEKWLRRLHCCTLHQSRRRRRKKKKNQQWWRSTRRGLRRGSRRERYIYIGEAAGEMSYQIVHLQYSGLSCKRASGTSPSLPSISFLSLSCVYVSSCVLPFSLLFSRAVVFSFRYNSWQNRRTGAFRALIYTARDRYTVYTARDVREREREIRARAEQLSRAAVLIRELFSARQ